MKKNILLATLPLLLTSLASCGEEVSDRNEPILNKAVWVWTETENGYTAQVKIPYSNNDYEVIDAKVTKEIANEHTCLEGGLDRYVASVTYYGVLLESKKEVITAPKGHDYSEYYITPEYHYEKCVCGDIKEGHAHTFGNEIIVEEADSWRSPGIAKKVCSTCEYENKYNIVSDEEYKTLKLNYIKSLLSNVTSTPVIEEIYKYTNLINQIKEVFDLLSYQEVNELDINSRSTLLSLLFDFNTILDTKVSHSYSVYNPLNYPFDKGTMIYGSTDPVYGDVTELYLNEDWRPFENPNLSYDNPNPFILINNPPKPTSETKKIVFYLYAPINGVKMNFKYLGLTSSGSDRTYLFTSHKSLNYGWNTIEISGSELGTLLSKDITKLRLEFISTDGLPKTVNSETWKFTSMFAANEPLGSMVSKIDRLPSIENLRAYDFLGLKSLYKRYSELPNTCKKIIDNNGKIEEYFNEVSKYVSLPYGDSYDIKINWNSAHKVTPCVDTDEIGPAFKINVGFDVTNGSYQHAIGATYKTSRQTAVFYTKNYNGELGVEYQGPGEASYHKFSELQKVKLSNGCYAHYITLDDYAKYNNLPLTACESKLCVKLRGTVEASKDVYLSPILHVDIKSHDVDDALAMLPNETPSSLNVSQKEIFDSVTFLYNATTEKSLVKNQAKLQAYFDKFIVE